MGPPHRDLVGEIREPSDGVDHLHDTNQNGERLPREGMIEVERHPVPLEVSSTREKAARAPSSESGAALRQGPGEATNARRSKCSS